DRIAPSTGEIRIERRGDAERSIVAGLGGILVVDGRLIAIRPAVPPRADGHARRQFVLDGRGVLPVVLPHTPAIEDVWIVGRRHHGFAKERVRGYSDLGRL